MGHYLSKAEVDQYQSEGYLVVSSLLEREDIERVDRVIEEVVLSAIGSGDYGKILELEPQTVDGHPVVRRIYNPFEHHNTFKALATNDRLLDRVESLVGPSIQLQHSKLNMKLARVGSPVEWHQDLTYFPHTNTDLVTVLVYLDAATRENGCLQVLSRCHHQFLDCHTPEGLFAGMITEDISRYGRSVPLEAPGGSAIFMHCMTPHSSLPNRSNHPRRTLIFEYRAADSYPIYFGPQVADAEQHAHHLRGQRARYARMGGPPPLIPVMPDNFKSLYQLQEDTKARGTTQ